MADSSSQEAMAEASHEAGAGEPMETEGNNQRRDNEDPDQPGLNDLQQLLQPVAGKWYQFGLQLDMNSTVLHEIEHETEKTPDEHMEEVLKHCLNRTEPKLTWRKVVNAVRGIEEGQLADNMEKQYCAMEVGEREGEEGKKKMEVPDYKTQKQEIQVLLQQRLTKGDTWYLVDIRWMKQWKKFVGYDQWDQSNAGVESANPGPIDNSNLFKDRAANTLKEHLMEELDYSLMPEAAWSKLHLWYGLSEGSSPIARNVVEYGLYMKHCKVEVYLLEFKLCIHPKINETVTKAFSRANTIADLEVELRQMFDIPKETECRVWHRYMTHTYELLSNAHQSLQDVGLYNGQIIVLERKNEDGTWPRMVERGGSRSTDNITGATGSSYSSSSSSSQSQKSSSYTGYGSYWSGGYQQPSTPGLCGLSNLGNTCFMNSALQCLSNTSSLTEYFTGTKAGYKPYKKHVNKDNPLGMGGAIAESYGALLEDIWSGKFSCVAPRQFKTQVGRYAPQFVGYAQHDSQELLAFLLDGLHEDLNLVKKKPYVDMSINTDGRNDKDVSEESWHKYLLRNQSVIVKVFQGQLKSTLICPKCQKVSRIFDPFMFLSLPLPIKKTRTLTVSLIRADPMEDIYKYKLHVRKRGQVNHLKDALSKITDIPPKMMVVVDVYNCRFHRIYYPEESLSHIMDRDDIYVYELTHSLDDKEWVQVPVYHREEIVREVRYSYQPYTQRYHHLFGLPLVVPVPRQDCTYRTLYSAITSTCRRYVKLWSDVKEQVTANNSDPPEEGGRGEDMPDEEKNQNQNLNLNLNVPRADSEDNMDSSNQDNASSADGDGTTEEGDGEGEREGEGKGEGEREGEREGEGEGEEKVKQEEEKEMDLFKLVVVNSYGSQEVQKLKDDANPLRLTSQTYIACDWTTEMKEKCYNLETAEDLKEHPSCKEKKEEKKTIHLLDCLKLFTDVEQLGEEDAWYCPDCKDFVQASKKFDLWKLPEILVIHLKRFSYDRYWRDKLDVLVDFPTTGLDLGHYMKNEDDPEPIYDLFAVSNHFGGMGGGHYTAYCKNKETGKWYNYDDSHVSETTEDHVMTASAYVLFYRRTTDGPSKVRILDRSLSQSFAEEVKQKGAKYQPRGDSVEEGEMETEEGESRENTSKRSRNESTENEVFEDAQDKITSDNITITSGLDEPD